MRIAEFSDSFLPIVDGVGRVVYSYAQNIGRRGHECYVIAPMSDSGYRGGLPFEIVDYHGVPLPKMPQYNAGIPLADAHYHARMETVKPEIVHLHSPFTAGQEGLRIAKKLGIPAVGTFHSKYYDDFLQVTGQEVIADVGVKYIVAFFERCDEVWAVSKSSAQTLQSYGYSGKITVMPNGVQPVQPDPEARARALAQFSPDGAPILLFVGQMNWKKNILRILEAAAMLKKDGVSFRLVLAGQGPNRDEIVKKCAELKISDITRFAGHITDQRELFGLYAAASLFVFPSIYDNAPMVVREAAQMGTPSVTVRGSSSAEPITDGENGLLCADRSADLYRVIASALAKPGFLEKLGENAERTVPITWDGIIDKVLECYQKIINAYPKARVRKSGLL